jgi:tripartite-type tricarboxylate transporter receptor subunit TctC
MKLRTGLLATLFLLPLLASAAAQDYPNRPITWVVPFPPGGVTDNGARFMAKTLGDKLGTTIVIENKPGAGGIVGTEYVANAKPDGYTFLYGSSGPMGTFLSLRKTLSYHPVNSFTPIHGMASSPLVLVTTADKPYKTLAELIEYARKNPGKLNFASVGQGTAQHLTGELLAMNTGIDIVHIPYKGTTPALTDMLSGTIDFMFDFSVVMKPLIEAGKLKPLAVSGEKRLSSLPDVPTAAELGYPGVVFSAWSSVVMPKGVPAEIAAKFAKAFAETMHEPTIVKYYEENGSQVMPSMPGEKLAEFYTRENAKMKTIVEKAKIPVD